MQSHSFSTGKIAQEIPVRETDFWRTFNYWKNYVFIRKQFCLALLETFTERVTRCWFCYEEDRQWCKHLIIKVHVWYRNKYSHCSNGLEAGYISSKTQANRSINVITKCHEIINTEWIMWKIIFNLHSKTMLIFTLVSNKQTAES